MIYFRLSVSISTKNRKTKLVSERIYKCRHNKETNKVNRLDSTHVGTFKNMTD